MKSNTQLNELWNAQETIIPDEKIIIEKATQLKRKIKLHASLGILSLILTIGIISWVWLSVDFTMLSTKIGISCVVLAIILSVLNAMRTLLSPSHNQEVSSTKDHLEQMLIVQDQQRFTQTAVMSAYFFLLSLGLLLYMYEPASKMPDNFGIIAYVITIAWIAFNWFYWRPKIIKKQGAKMDETIAKLRELSAELDG